MSVLNEGTCSVSMQFVAVKILCLWQCRTRSSITVASDQKEEGENRPLSVNKFSCLPVSRSIFVS